MAYSESTGRIEIVTASWYTSLPAEVVRIGISRGPPRDQRGYRMLRVLAPGPWFSTVGEQEFNRLYQQQLDQLDPELVYRRLAALAAGQPCAALLCFERPETGQCCHRSMVATWMGTALGIRIPEYGFEHLPPDDHPMMGPSLAGKRRSPDH